VRDQVSHPYKTTGRITVLYILTFTFLDTRRNITINQMENITTKFTVLSWRNTRQSASYPGTTNCIASDIFVQVILGSLGFPYWDSQS
jgi:hypothetical protein